MIQSGYRTWNNPAMVVENFTGIPIHRVHQEMKKKEERKEIEVKLGGFGF